MIRWAEDYFDTKGFENPRGEIEWLLGDLLQCSRLDLYLRFEEPLAPKHLAILREWIKRRIKNEPLQYITGSTEFYGLSFKVTPDVLIPRPETERVVDVAIHTLGGNRTPRILDVGTGTGCIAVPLAKEFPGAEVIGIDISTQALEIAKQNATTHNAANIHFQHVDIMQETIPGPFDLLVSNPPYIPLEELSTLMESVRDYEPHLALTDGKAGLTFYERFRELGPQIVKSGGWLVMEVGLGEHPAKARDIFKEPEFSDNDLVKDLNGDDRVLKVQVK